jgi:hypothetical protein
MIGGGSGRVGSTKEERAAAIDQVEQGESWGSSSIRAAGRERGTIVNMGERKRTILQTTSPLNFVHTGAQSNGPPNLINTAAEQASNWAWVGS